MPVENDREISTANAIRDLFAPALKPGEEIKVLVGQRVDLNDSNFGKTQDRLSLEVYQRLRESVLSAGAEKVDVSKTETGKKRVAEFEVLAVTNKDGKKNAISRSLFRQEKTKQDGVGFPISINVLADLALDTQEEEAEAETPDEVKTALTTEKSEPAAGAEVTIVDKPAVEAIAESEPDTTEAASTEVEVPRATEEAIATDEPNAPETVSAKLEIPVVPEEAIAESEPNAPETTSNAVEATETTQEAPEEVNASEAWTAWRAATQSPQQEAESEGDEPTVDVSNTAKHPTEITALTRQTGQPQSLEEDAVPIIGNTLETLQKITEALPESPTKALFQNISAEFSALSLEVQQLRENAKPERVSSNDLIEQGKTKLKEIQKSLKKRPLGKRIEQFSATDAKGIALKGLSTAVEKSSTGLGIASRYLRDRSQRVEEYGMAKAALSIYQKGHIRTGENSFSKDGYTVFKEEDYYRVLDSKQRLVMAFDTNKKGQPTNVEQTPYTQREDKWALNKIAKSKVIEGTMKAEQAYSKRILNMDSLAREVIGSGGNIKGKNFHITRQGDTVTIATQTFPRRTATVDKSGQIESSSLTHEDSQKLGQSLVIQADQRADHSRIRESKKEEMTV